MRQTRSNVVVVGPEALQRILTGDERVQTREELAEPTDRLPIGDVVIRYINTFEIFLLKIIIRGNRCVIIRTYLKFFQTKEEKTKIQFNVEKNLSRRKQRCP